MDLTRIERAWVRSPRLTRVKAFLSILLVTAAAFSEAAQQPPTCPPETRAPSTQEIEVGMRNARDRGFLWRIVKDGRASYLYGTIHVGRLEWTFPGPETLKAFRASDRLALELDVSDPDIIQRLQKGTALKPGSALKEPFGQRLRAQLKIACLSEQLLGLVAPEMLATTLTAMAARSQGFDPAYAVDAALAGLARGHGKPVASLETPELQLKLLLGGSQAESQALVESALDELEKGKASAMLAHMTDVWSLGRLGELEAYERWCECVETEAERAMMRRLLDERNPGLASGIDAIHASGRTVFAAVGSLHMIGKAGLPALLSERGYKVERIAFKP